MRLLRFARAVLFSRGLVVLLFWIITISVCIKVMWTTSFVVGAAALAACALCYVAAAGFMGSLLARRAKGYRSSDLFGIGSICLLIIIAGLLLMMWSGFSMRVFDIEISGVTWALVGAASAVVVVGAKDALKGESPS